MSILLDFEKFAYFHSTVTAFIIVFVRPNLKVFFSRSIIFTLGVFHQIQEQSRSSADEQKQAKLFAFTLKSNT